MWQPYPVIGCFEEDPAIRLCLHVSGTAHHLDKSAMLTGQRSLTFGRGAGIAYTSKDMPKWSSGHRIVATRVEEAHLPSFGRQGQAREHLAENPRIFQPHPPPYREDESEYLLCRPCDPSSWSPLDLESGGEHLADQGDISQSLCHEIKRALVGTHLSHRSIHEFACRV